MPETDIAEDTCQKQDVIHAAGGDSIVSLQSTDGEGEEASLEIDIKEDQKDSSKASQDSISDSSTKRGADSDSLGTVGVKIFKSVFAFLCEVRILDADIC